MLQVEPAAVLLNNSFYDLGCDSLQRLELLTQLLERRSAEGNEDALVAAFDMVINVADYHRLIAAAPRTLTQ